MNYTSIAKLARECQTHTGRIIEWADGNGIEVFMAIADNGKQARSIKDSDAESFRSMNNEMDDSFITIPQLSKDAQVDRQTIRSWADKNNVTVITIPQISKGRPSPPTQCILRQDAEKFLSEFNVNSDAVVVNDILEEFQTDWRVVMKWAEENRIQFVKCPNNGRWKKGLSQDDAKSCRAYLTEMRSIGHFYMIQLIPNHDPKRIKFGYAKDVDRRLSAHKVTCPEAKVIAYWKCTRDQERCVIRSLTKTCTPVTFEVFDNCDVDTIISEAEAYFNDTNII